MPRKHYCALWMALAGCASLRATPADLLRQSSDDALRKSVSCVSSGCHTAIEPMHVSPAVRLGCTDCHGGRADSTDKNEAHVQARYPREWKTSGNPERSYTLLNREKMEYVQFRNPGDLRVAEQTCGSSERTLSRMTGLRASGLSETETGSASRCSVRGSTPGFVRMTLGPPKPAVRNTRSHSTLPRTAGARPMDVSTCRIVRRMSGGIQGFRIPLAGLNGRPQFHSRKAGLKTGTPVSVRQMSGATPGFRIPATGTSGK